jgi:hypothetical protein
MEHLAENEIEVRILTRSTTIFSFGRLILLMNESNSRSIYTFIVCYALLLDLSSEFLEEKYIFNRDSLIFGCMNHDILSKEIGTLQSMVISLILWSRTIRISVPLESGNLLDSVQIRISSQTTLPIQLDSISIFLGLQ